MRTLVGLAVVASGALALAPGRAHAGIDACGNIHVEAQAQCEVVPPSVDCEAMCEPLTVRAACSATLAAECRAGCDELPSVMCSGSCEASCQADCEAEPGMFDCEASCEADCNGSCAANCEANSDRSACMASCEGSCSASCDSHCNVVPPMVDCDAGCKASCEGSCEVDSNIDCQADCQAEGRADCEAEVSGGCEADCNSEEGALFCDGQYVDHGNNLDECVAALEASLDITVMTWSEGSASCSGGRCMAEGEAGVSSECSVANPGAGTGAPGWLGLGALALLGLAIRRRRG